MDKTARHIQKKTKCECIQKDDGIIVIYSTLDEIEKHLSFLRDDEKCRFELLIDIFGIDYPQFTQHCA